MNQKLGILLLVAVLIGAVVGMSIWIGGGTGGRYALVPLVAPETGPITLDAMSPEGVRYVGMANCVPCHEEEHRLWEGSHHDLAMQVATSKTVLGDFDDAKFELRGVTSTFFKKDGRYWVRTQNEKGGMEDYPVLYVFGVEPLQQYLVEFPGGKLQCLPLAWDTRPRGEYKLKDGTRGEAGQEWFHLYPDDEDVVPGDALFWTEVNQNWNFMCAECHSTNLQKKFDVSANRYETTWSEINVACEACHGPGEKHVDWANAIEGKDQEDYGTALDMGLTVNLKNGNGGAWVYNAMEGVYVRSQPLKNRVQSEMCARCHARRFVTDELYVHGKSFHDTHVVEVLGETIYEADGQIKDEVYVYGSFIQSLMYQKGVRCVDCHDPHSTKLQREGNALCTSCHDPGLYDSKKHHFHEVDGEGASCKDCHMLDRLYMQVDWRQDHSFRVPRPDLSVKLGTPNTCTDCHNDQTDEWALEKVNEWYGPYEEREARPHFAHTIAAARNNASGSDKKLGELAVETGHPAIARATALEILRDRGSSNEREAILGSLSDSDPMVRTRAVSALDVLPSAERWLIAMDYLDDPVKSVRLEAVRVMAEGYIICQVDEERERFEAATEEFIASQLVNGDRGSAHMNLGVLYANMGEFAKARAAYEQGIRVEPYFIPLYINYADYFRNRGEEEYCESVLRRALKVYEKAWLVHNALGQTLVRQGKKYEALESFRWAYELDDGTNNAMFLAITLSDLAKSSGDRKKRDESLRILHRQLERFPEDYGLLYTLSTTYEELGAREQAILFATRLVQLNPDDRAAAQLLYYLSQGQ